MPKPQDGTPYDAERPALAKAQPGHPQWTMPTAKMGEDLVLMPGQLYFGTRAASVRTLLGSCVAITLWNPQRRLGGMCHYLLPRRNLPSQDPPEGRYGDEAMALLLQWLRMARTEPQDYEVHLYGGADTQPGVTGQKTGIGIRNIEIGWSLIDQFGFQLQAVDVGENMPRHVRLCLATGQVDMRRGAAITDKSQPAGPSPGRGHHKGQA